MSHAHIESAAGRLARAGVITVTTSRSPAEDRSGPLLRDLLVGAGHAARDPVVVPDDPDRIGAALEALLGDPDVDLVLLTGGTGISARDCTPKVVGVRLERELPGFGEIFRALSFAEIGSAAMLSSALGGIAQGKVVFALPGSTAGCRLAMEKLILPELGHLLAELAKESPLRPPPRVVEANVPKITPVIRESAGRRPPDAGPPPVRPAGSGKAGASPGRTMTIVEVVLLTIGASFEVGTPVVVPEALTRYPAAMDVIDASGERVAVRFEDGALGFACGYPDLKRPAAKVLLVRPAASGVEVIAAHKGLQGVGLCASDAPSQVLPSREDRLAAVTKMKTGAAYEGAGTVFAVDVGAVYFEEEGRIHRWDGRQRSTVGTVGQAMGSLFLSWSQR